MCSGCLRNLIVGSGLHRVNEIGELNCILNEENGDIIADNVKVTLISVAIYLVIRTSH